MTLKIETWSPPASFDRHEPIPFPVHVLPPWLADFVTATSLGIQVPADMMAMLTLAALSACCAGRFRIEVKDGYTEPLNLFVLVVLGPGNRKSAAFNLATAPLEEFEREHAERMRATVAARAAEQAVLRKAISYAQGKAARTTDPNERHAWLERCKELALQLELCSAPVSPRLLADDVTPQRLGALLADNGGRLAVLSAEGGWFDRLTAQASLDIILKAHAGDSIRVDRVTRGAEFIASPALTVGLTVQPEVLRGLAGKPGFRGRGLLARFLYALPLSPLGSRDVDAPSAPPSVLEEYRTRLRDLLALNADPRSLQLSAAAQDAWLSFARALEPRLAEDGDLAPIADWGAKLGGACARLAGLLHAAAHGPEADAIPVDSATMVAAASLAEHLIGHAKLAFAEMKADPVVEDAMRLLRWLEQTSSATFTARAAFQALKGRLKAMAKLRPVLSLLEDHGYIRRIEMPTPRGPGRPSEHFAVNPMALDPEQASFEAIEARQSCAGLDDHGSNEVAMRA